MNKFAIIVVISVAVGVLMYMNQPAKQGVQNMGTEAASAENPSSLADRIWSWLDGDSTQPSKSSAGHVRREHNQPGGPQQSDESTRTISQNLISTTDQDFENDVLKASGQVIVEFWKPGCPSCEATEPELVKLAAELDGRVKVVKLNTLESRETRGHFSIPGVPTLLLFENGKVVKKEVGGGTVRQMKTGLGLS